MADTVWQPIAGGEIATAIWESIASIAAELPLHERSTRETLIFWSYLSAAMRDPATPATILAKGDEICEREALAVSRFAEEVQEELGGPTKGMSLFYGLPNTAWTISHLCDDEDVLTLLDERLTVVVAGPRPWFGHYDLVGGLVGMAVYMLERAKGPDGNLRALAELLASLCERNTDGAKWHTRPELLPTFQRQICPTGFSNCGMAHGSAGVVAALNWICDLFPDYAGLRDDAVRWLVRQYGSNGFPSWICDGLPKPARVAWCYGDPGVTMALLGAGIRGLQIDGLSEMIRSWMSRPDTGCIDAGFCHGAVGLAHIANRMFQATGEDLHRRVALEWLRRVLAYRSPGRGIAGFLAFDGSEKRWGPDPSLATGAVGIGLGLLASVTSLVPRWDRAFLCDLP